MTRPLLDLRGPRVQLRPWRSSDREAFAALNADPRVMEHLPSLLTRDESDALADRIEAMFAEHAFGFWALETPDSAFAGFVGLGVPSFEAPFTPCVEVAWRLAHAHWSKGYATEGARVALRAAFGPLGLSEIVAFTVPGNVRSRAVMSRLGMQHSPEEDFDHPRLPQDHRLRRHVLYRIRRDALR